MTLSLPNYRSLTMTFQLIQISCFNQLQLSYRSYIHSLETSFVNKLNHSMRLRGCHLQKNVQGPHSTQELPFKTYNSSERFMVVRGKINFPRNETLLESTADSHVTLPSPWICHFTAACKKFNMASPNLRAHTLSSNNRTHPRRNTTLKESIVTARISEHNPACYQYSASRTIGNHQSD